MNEDLINFMFPDLSANLITFPTPLMANFGIIVPFNNLRAPNIRDSALLRKPDPSLVPWFWTDLKVERTGVEKMLCAAVITGTVVMTFCFIVKILQRV